MREELDTASARMRPPLICSANSPMPETPAVTWPATLRSDALLFQCVKSFNARRAGYGKRAHAPTFNLLGKFADAGNAGGHVAADDRGNRFAAALVGNVVDLTGIKAC